MTENKISSVALLVFHLNLPLLLTTELTFQSSIHLFSLSEQQQVNWTTSLCTHSPSTSLVFFASFNYYFCNLVTQEHLKNPF